MSRRWDVRRDAPRARSRAFFRPPISGWHTPHVPTQRSMRSWGSGLPSSMRSLAEPPRGTENEETDPERATALSPLAALLAFATRRHLGCGRADGAGCPERGNLLEEHAHVLVRRISIVERAQDPLRGA
jgi:hypothetical protein